MSDTSPDPLPSPTDNAKPRPRLFVWLLGATVGVSLAVLAGGNLPERIKLLGLLPLAWAAALGAAGAWWANECQLSKTRGLLLLACLLLALGETGVVLESWWSYRSALQKQFAKDPSSKFTLASPDTASKLTSEEQEQLRQYLAEIERVRIVRQRELSLSKYLQRRLKPLGSAESPWPVVFWASEIVFGSLLGTWTMKRVMELQNKPEIKPSV